MRFSPTGPNQNESAVHTMIPHPIPSHPAAHAPISRRNSAIIPPRVPITPLLRTRRLKMYHRIARHINPLLRVHRPVQRSILVFPPPLLDDALGAAGHGQRVCRSRLAGGLGAVLERRVVAGVAAGADGGEADADFLGQARQEGLDHGDVVDDDGDEGFAHRPAAGLLGAVRSGLEN